jgi:hypothetical protein
MEDDETDILSDGLTPVKESEVPFRGKKLITATLVDQQGYVTVNSLCDAFGLDRKGQKQRLMRSGYWMQYAAQIRMTTPKGPRATWCISAVALPVFLTGVDVERVQNPEARELIEAFLDESMEVLAEHFGISEKTEMKFMRSVVARMVSEHEEGQGRLKKVEAELAEMRKAHDEKVGQIRTAFGDLRQQVSKIAMVAGPKVRLAPEQIGQLREAVENLALVMIEKAEIAKPYPSIYGDIVRMTGVSKIEDIQQQDLDRVLTWIDRRVKAYLKMDEEEEEEQGQA